jgi:type IV pilus assembly protein PilV
VKQAERGFTVLEVLISLVVLTIGMLGIMALQGTAVKANRISRELEQARVFTSQAMEDLRGKSVATLGTGGAYPTLTTSDGTVYTRTFTVSAVPSEANLKVITVTTSFDEDGDPANRHTATLQVVRTLTEGL